MSSNPLKYYTERQNAWQKLGPKSPRKNDLGDEIHHLTNDMLDEVDRRYGRMRGDLRASGDLQEFFVRRAATMTVRVDYCVRHESAAIAAKVRRAEADFDAARLDKADQLFDWITAEPQANARQLHETVEGVDRMIRAFQGLKDDLLHPSKAFWDWSKVQKVENLLGRRMDDEPKSRTSAFSEAVLGDLKFLGPDDAPDLDVQARREWARDRLAELLDAEVERLEAYRTTFDHDEIARERAESVDLAYFDPSKEASEARKYEAASERSLYRALKELRQVQANATRAIERVEEPEDLPPDVPQQPPVEQPRPAPSPRCAPPSPMRHPELPPSSYGRDADGPKSVGAGFA